MIRCIYRQHGWIFFQKILILLSGWFWKILICWRAKMIIFGNICQIIRKRCQMMKQMRKKAHLEEKYLVLGGFCPKNMVKEQFFCALRALKILILLNFAQKSLLFPPPPLANSEEYSPMCLTHSSVYPTHIKHPQSSSPRISGRSGGGGQRKTFSS